MKLRITKQDPKETEVFEEQVTEHDLKDMRLLIMKHYYSPGEMRVFAEQFESESMPITIILPHDADISTYTLEADLSDCPTRELVEELKKREGVDIIEIAPYDRYRISGGGEDILDTGPAILFIVTD